MNRQLSDFIDQEQLALLVNSKNWDEATNLASDAWAWFFTPAYLTDLKPLSQLAIAYKVQADQALSQAIVSILRAHFAQATSRLRFALENLMIAIAILSEPDPMYELFNNRDKPTPKSDKALKTKAYEIVGRLYPELDREVHKFKDTLSDNGSHQSAGLLKGGIDIHEGGITTYLQDKPNDPLIAATFGFVPETVLLFHPWFVKAGEARGLVAVNPDAMKTAGELRARTDRYKARVRHLWGDLLN